MLPKAEGRCHEVDSVTCIREWGNVREAAGEKERKTYWKRQG